MLIFNHPVLIYELNGLELYVNPILSNFPKNINKMEKTKTITTGLYGNVYPFYLENNRLSNYLVYQIYSPGVDDLFRPTLSLKLIGENLPFNSKKDKTPTRKELMNYHFNDLKIFNYSLKDNESAEGDELNNMAVESVNEMLKKFKTDEDLPRDRRFEVYQGKDGEFPRFTLNPYSTDPQKSVIIYLRNSIRWTKYKFAPGSLVDVLWTPNTFVVFKIEGNNNEMWLTPQAEYNLKDADLKNPKPVNNIDFTQEYFSRDKAKISDFNNAIKLLEWKSFERK